MGAHAVLTSYPKPDPRYLLHNNVVLELNPAHPIIKRLAVAQTSNPDLAELVALQLFDNALMNADLVQVRRPVTGLYNTGHYNTGHYNTGHYNTGLHL